jgi:hypothetical protein
MAEFSLPWDTGSTGDGASAFTEQQIKEWLRDTFTTDRYTSEGVLAGVGNQLACTSATNQVTVASGAAMAYGTYYQNTAPTAIAVTSPVGGTTGLRVNLRVVWSTQTVRAVVVKNTDGTSSTPALTQTAGTTWDIPLATGTITTGGAITLTDARDYCHFGAALVYRRQGGGADWTTPGPTNYTPGGTKWQPGSVTVTYTSGTGTASVTFPSAFGQVPHVQLTVYNAGSSTKRKILATVESVTTTTLVIRVYLTDESTGSSTVDVFWEAIGDE